MTQPSLKLNLATSQIKSFLQSSEERACLLTAIFNKVFPLYHINSLPRVQMLLAQLAHESQMFSHYQENLNYSATALAETWPFRFSVDSHAKIKVPNALAKKIQRQPKLIANSAYGGRMGNDTVNDGWDLRGSGAIQTTGKENISAYANFKGFNNVYDTAKLMRESDEYAIDSGCWYVSVYKNLLDEMDRGHLNHVTVGINGSLIGIEDRSELFERAKKMISII